MNSNTPALLRFETLLLNKLIKTYLLLKIRVSLKRFLVEKRQNNSIIAV